MARSKKERMKAREEKFAGLLAFATQKFSDLNKLNKDIDAKTNSDMSRAEKLTVANRRTQASNLKNKMVARQSYATIAVTGAGSSTGFYNDQTVRPARGKQKVKKTPSQPRVKFKGE